MISHPFGMADVQAPAHAVTQNITVTNQGMTIFRPAIATANVAVNVTADAALEAGAQLLVVFKTTATETLTFGNGIDGILITGVAGKTKTKLFAYDGTIFIATNEQID
jgi:hypothetical protein